MTQHLIKSCQWSWYLNSMKVKVKVAQSCPTLCNPMDCTVRWIFQTRILEWIAFPFSRGFSQPRDRTQVSCIAGGFFTNWPIKLSFVPFLFFPAVQDPIRTSLVAQTVKRLPTMWESRVRSLGRKDPLKKEMATHSSILAWKIPWAEDPGRLQSMGSQRVGHDWATSLTQAVCKVRAFIINLTFLISLIICLCFSIDYWKRCIKFFHSNCECAYIFFKFINFSLYNLVYTFRSLWLKTVVFSHD